MANDIALLPIATVSGANTATRITAAASSPTSRTYKNVHTVIIQALVDNGADVYVGDSTVDSTTKLGICLTAGSSVRLPWNGWGTIDLSNIYFASTDAAAKVCALYQVA